MENWKPSRLSLMTKKLLMLFILAIFICLCTLSTINSRTTLDIKQRLTGTTDFYLQNFAEGQEGINRGMASRRFLRGPGSSPPRCTSKCGRCTPCTAVQVAVPPGTSPVNAEYYPVAWRCKCGKRLYMP